MPIKLISKAFNAVRYFLPILTTLAFINLMQCLSYVVSLISPRRSLIFNGFLFGMIQKMFQHHIEKVAGVDIVITGDELPDNENCIMISNHMSYTDFMMLHSLAVRKNRIDDVKYFAKDELKWIPFFGS